MTLALFDFDGTITTKDSLEGFILFAHGAQRYYLGLLYLAPMLLLYKLNIIPNHRAKEILLSHFFKGVSKKELECLGEAYACQELKSIIRPKALDALQEHQRRGDEVAIVSASIKCWLEPWCRQHRITLLSTELAFENTRFNGRFRTKNCYGIEKVNRVTEHYNLNNFDTIYAYGDSEGDTELLALATHAFYKPFR